MSIDVYPLLSVIYDYGLPMEARLQLAYCKATAYRAKTALKTNTKDKDIFLLSAGKTFYFFTIISISKK